jgi:hypothetical protein
MNISNKFKELRTAAWWTRYEIQRLMDEARLWDQENYDPDAYDKWQDYR